MILKLLFGWLIVWVIRTKLCNKRNNNSPQRGTVIHDAVGKITGSFFHINYETNCANELMAQWFNPGVRWKRELLEVWFSGGVLLMGLGQCMSLCLFTYILYKSLITLAIHHDVLSDDFSEPVESPIVIPGYNVEFGQLVLFWTCTLVVLLVHEVGHAAAASMERLYIQGFGIFFAVLFPGAYVRVENSIQYLPTRAQLRIYSAGVWHNFCFALVIFGAIELGPYLLAYSPYQHLSVGLTVLSIAPSSPLRHAVHTGSVISSINGIDLHSISEFESMIRGYDTLLSTAFSVSTAQQTAFNRFLKHPEPLSDLSLGRGFCREVDLLQRSFDEKHADLASFDYDPLDCCHDLFNGQGSDADGYCFAVNTPGGKLVNNHIYISLNGTETMSNFDFNSLTCLSPREVVQPPGIPGHSHQSSGVDRAPYQATESELSHPAGILKELHSSNGDFCLSDGDCSDSTMKCVRPLSASPLTLLRIDIVGRAEPLIVEYPPASLISSLKLSSYAISSRYLSDILLQFPMVYRWAVEFPSSCYFFCWLCIQLSLSVGLLNMMPAKYLDGGLAFPQFARIYIPRRWCTWVSDVIVGFGSCLLLLNLLIFAIPMMKPTIDFVLGLSTAVV